MQAGQQLGHYEVLEKIGEGGMGAVWKARDTRLGRLVALKALSSNMLTDEGRRRLMQEARAASILQHPNIVTLHDVGSHDGIDYLVMEYVAGETLDHRIQRGGPLPPDELLRIGMAIASALSHAHDHGLIHRDLKPANVIITPDGTPKLLDFGLAKRMWTESAAISDETLTQADFTEAGAIIGTISYMSPEQAQGRPLDARSDIFSLGAVLYEMASGRRAFQGPNKLSTLTAILRDEPMPLPEIVKDTPAYLNRSVIRCLRKAPEERYPNADELRRDLSTSPAPAPAAPEAQLQRPRPKWMVPAVAAFWVIVLGAAVLLLWKTGPPPAAPAGVVPGKTITVTPFTNLPGIESNPRWSPDGNRLAFLSGGDLYTKDVATGTVAKVTRAGSYAWSPDSSRFAVIRDGAIVTVPSEEKIAEAPGEPRGGMSWSPDGSTLVFSQPSGADTANLVALKLSDRSMQQLTPVRGAYSDLAPSFSPDGQQVAFVSRFSNIRATIQVVPAKVGGASRQVGPEFTQLIGVDWSGDGKSLYFTGTRDGAAGVWHVAADAPAGTAAQAVANGRFYQLSVARSGPLRIAAPQAPSDVNRAEADIVLIEEK
jgi:serine/threonine protein kinase